MDSFCLLRFLLPIALVPIGGRNLQTVRQPQRKVTNAAPLTFTEKHFLPANQLFSLPGNYFNLTLPLFRPRSICSCQLSPPPEINSICWPSPYKVGIDRSIFIKDLIQKLIKIKDRFLDVFAMAWFTVSVAGMKNKIPFSYKIIFFFEFLLS
jgi:hypothetical protein